MSVHPIIESMARAAYEAQPFIPCDNFGNPRSPWSWDILADSEKYVYFLRQAAAFKALAALEPSEGMVEVMADGTDFIFSDQVPDMDAQRAEMRVAWRIGMKQLLKEIEGSRA